MKSEIVEAHVIKVRILAGLTTLEMTAYKCTEIHINARNDLKIKFYSYQIRYNATGETRTFSTYAELKQFMRGQV